MRDVGRLGRGSGRGRVGRGRVGRGRVGVGARVLHPRAPITVGVGAGSAAWGLGWGFGVGIWGLRRGGGGLWARARDTGQIGARDIGRRCRPEIRARDIGQRCRPEIQARDTRAPPLGADGRRAGAAGAGLLGPVLGTWPLRWAPGAVCLRMTRGKPWPFGFGPASAAGDGGGLAECPSPVGCRRRV